MTDAKALACILTVKSRCADKMYTTLRHNLPTIAVIGESPLRLKYLEDMVKKHMNGPFPIKRIYHEQMSTNKLRGFSHLFVVIQDHLVLTEAQEQAIRGSLKTTANTCNIAVEDLIIRADVGKMPTEFQGN